MAFGLSLNSRMILGFAVMLVISMIPSVIMIGYFYDDYARARDSVGVLEVFRQGLDVDNAIGAELQSVYSLLDPPPAADRSGLRELAALRDRTDKALAEFRQALTSGRIGATDPALGRLADLMGERLQRARGRFDAVLTLPKEVRTLDQISTAVAVIVDSVYPFHQFISRLVALTAAEEPRLAAPALVSQMLCDLRENAARLRSLIVPYMAARQPISPVALRQIERLRERLLELWQMSAGLGGQFADDEVLQSVRRTLGEGLLSGGLAVIEQMIAEGGADGNYRISSSEFSDRYRPMVATIETLRNGFVEAAFRREVSGQTKAQWMLTLMTLVSAAQILLMISLIVDVRFRVLRPLLLASEQIIALADGALVEVVGSPTRIREIKRLFDAMEDLRQILRERLRYTELLKNLSETDELTGLMNRRSFDALGRNDPSYADLPQDVGLILMDLDWFKQINDSHGHAVGDEVLKRVADLMRRMTRSTEIAIRYGGEELAIVVLEQPRQASWPIAERIRGALERDGVVLDSGRRIPVTASFGIAYGRRSSEAWKQLIQDADRALYRAKAAGRNRISIAEATASAFSFA